MTHHEEPFHIFWCVADAPYYNAANLIGIPAHDRPGRSYSKVEGKVRRRARRAWRPGVDGLHHEWQDNKFLFAFQALGMAVGGSVAVEPERVVVEAKVPLAAMLMKRAIEDRLRREINEILTP